MVTSSSNSGLKVNFTSIDFGALFVSHFLNQPRSLTGKHEISYDQLTTMANQRSKKKNIPTKPTKTIPPTMGTTKTAASFPPVRPPLPPLVMAASQMSPSGHTHVPFVEHTAPLKQLHAKIQVSYSSI